MQGTVWMNQMIMSLYSASGGTNPVCVCVGGVGLQGVVEVDPVCIWRERMQDGLGQNQVVCDSVHL